MSFAKIWRALRDRVRLSYNMLRWRFKPDGDVKDFAFARLRHLVIAKMDGKLGDSQVITPFINILRRECQQLAVTVICTPNVAPIYHDILGLQTVEVPNKAQPHQVQEALNRAQALFAIPVDALLTTEPNFRSRDLCLNFLLKPAYLIGIEDRSGTVNINLKASSFGKHITEYFADLLTAGGIPESSQDPDYVPLYTQKEADLAAGVIVKPCLGIAPYGASSHRRLSDAVLQDLLQFVAEKTFFNAALLFKPSAHLMQSAAELLGDRLLALPGMTTVLEYAALIGKCSVILTVDSAAVHLANGSRVPAFCLYGGLDPDGIKRWGPAPFASECTAYSKQGCAIDELSFADFQPVFFDFLHRQFHNELTKFRE